MHACVVRLRGANLRNACLRGAQLVSTDGNEAVSLEDADLRGAILRGDGLGVSEETKKTADLRGANLTEAAVTDANLRGARYDAETSWPESFEPEASGAVAD
jgi:uncharacterized protein YjbI with pentapeptide repeats